jgi:threonine dehydrogenase-like Zn-dependent dehydrogenase
VRTAVYHGPRAITVDEWPDPGIIDPRDAIVQILLAGVCGSQLQYFRGASPHPLGPVGHEFIGIVEQVGPQVAGLAIGDLVVAPFSFSDGTCVHCCAGWQSQCLNGGFFGHNGTDGGQGDAARVPFADTTLVGVPGNGHSQDVLRSLVSLSDVMCTGHHGAVSAGVGPGSVVAVVGEGAVGLCAVLAARRLGAERIIALSRYPARQQVALEFGATDIVAGRGETANEEVLKLTGGVGVDAVIECVGSEQSRATAFAISRPGAIVGAVGEPHGGEVPMEAVFRNVALRGGLTPARRYIPELLEDVLAGRINPGRVFDYETDLAGIADAYAAMDERRAIKSLVRIGAGK